MSLPFQSLSLEDRVTLLEAHVRDLMGPLKIMEDTPLPPGATLKALEHLARLIGILQGRVDALQDRVTRIERTGWP